MTAQPGEIKIEKGIPIPSQGLRESGAKPVLSKMKIGDSIMVSVAQKPSFATAAQRMRMRITTRTLPGKINVRMWRVK